MHRPTLRAKDRVYSRRLALAKAVHRRKNLLFHDGDEGGPNRAAARQKAWEDVKMELVNKGFAEFASKSQMDIRKTDWQHVRRYVMDKRKREVHTGVIEEPITELDEVVMEIVGAEGLLKASTPLLNESSSSDPIKLEDHRSVSVNGQEISSSGLNDVASSDSADVEMNDHLLDGRLNSSTANILFPQLLQSFQDAPSFVNQLSFNQASEDRDFEHKIRDYRIQREEFQTQTEKIRNEIEAERLLQEKIRTRLLMNELAKSDPNGLSDVVKNGK
ncbi:unnamed protein product [Bursaphelenchus xylophilus]|uniref:(pine wood nematode) hypothetical protein n=1 Tax=Bursaphelenchus xylophilus TaxID=6326 RepID=A0A1I7S1L4_BURXY|nr:unnamed protein product [Bursaphelenchus xylophilus]CAG9081303.1 unnamed protein product [Bursaphelenchus xylophilus]